MRIIMWCFRYLAVVFLFISCDIQKSALKSKSDLDLVSDKEVKLFRSGDSVSYRPGKVQYRDTTIYRVTKNNTRLETVYDSNGNIRDINCYAAQIEELTRENMQLKYSEKNKASEKSETANFDWMFYLIGGVVVVVVVGFFILLKLIGKYVEEINLLAKKTL